MSPCFQGDPGRGFWPKDHGPYTSKEECDAECSILGACCDGESCTLKTKCECRDIPGAYFLGAGTDCNSDPCPCTPVATLCAQDWDAISWTADIVDVVLRCTPHKITTRNNAMVSQDQINRSGICLKPSLSVEGSWVNRGCNANAFADEFPFLTLTACERSDGSVRYDLYWGATNVISSDANPDLFINGFLFSKTLPSSAGTCPDEIVFTADDLASNLWAADNGVIDITGGEIRLQIQSCTLAEPNGFCGWWCDSVGEPTQTPAEYDVEVTLPLGTATFTLYRQLDFVGAAADRYEFINVANSLQIIQFEARFINDCFDAAGTYRIYFYVQFYTGTEFIICVGTSDPIAAGTCCPEGVSVPLIGAGFYEGQTLGSVNLLC